MSAELRQAVCLRIYVGEEKCERDRPLYQAIIHQARQTDIALMT
jgi:PII-like signaling protein